MTIIDAVWELRNLDLKVKEVAIEEADSTESVMDQLRCVDAEYIVVKAPVLKADLYFGLSQMGYTYVESMLRLRHDMILPSLTPENEALMTRVKMRQMTNLEQERMVRSVEMGVYHNDRISVDPYFSQQLANRRYSFWIQDEIKRGTSFWQFELEDCVFGFVGVQRTQETAHDVLNGIYPEFRGRGLSKAFTYHTVQEYQRRGAKFLTTDISSNNPLALKRCLNYGYTLEKMTYIWVKHNLPKEEYLKRVSQTEMLEFNKNGEYARNEKD